MIRQIVLLLLLTLTACQHKKIKKIHESSDPLAYFNAPVLYFNTILDRGVLEPVAIFYKYRVPKKAQTCVRNFINNILEPVHACNHLLQGKGRSFMVNVTRFLFNTILGFVGLVDAAATLGLKPIETNFDTTLAQWGVPKGPYLILPVIGPSYARKAIGEYFDLIANPGLAATYNPLWTRGTAAVILRSDSTELLNNIYYSSSNFLALYDTYYSFTIQLAPSTSSDKKISYVDTVNDDIF